MPGNESVIYGFLTGQLHLSDAQAAGGLGGFEVESGFDPTAYNPSEGAIGIAQWEGGRRTALQRYAAAHGGKETDLAIQLGFLALELRGAYRGVYNRIRGTSDAATAAAYWDVGPGGANSGTGYENSSGEATITRQQNARSIYQQIQTGQLTPTASPPIGGAQPSWPSGKIPSWGQVMADATKGTLGGDELIAWLDHQLLNKPVGLATLVIVNTKIVPMLTAAKASGAPVLAAVHVDTDAGALGVVDSAGAHHVYPWQGVLDPGIGERINDLIAGAGGAVGDALGGAFKWVIVLATKLGFTGAGLALAVLGLYAAAHPPQEAS